MRAVEEQTIEWSLTQRSNGAWANLMATVRLRIFKLAAEHDVRNTLVCAGTGARASNQLGRRALDSPVSACVCMRASMPVMHLTKKSRDDLHASKTLNHFSVYFLSDFVSKFSLVVDYKIMYFHKF